MAEKKTTYTFKDVEPSLIQLTAGTKLLHQTNPENVRSLQIELTITEISD
jgi:hypothetical protein